jgi:hypothetical protein
MPIDKDQLDRLRAEHGKRIVHLKRTIEDEEIEAVFRRPTPLEYKRCLAESQDDEVKGQAFDKLCATCVLFPERDAFAAVLVDFPGLAHAFGNALLTSVGLGKAEVVKK